MSTNDELDYWQKVTEYRLENERYRFYKPTGAGEKFINTAFSGKYFIVLQSGANGMGKSLLGIECFANLMFPCGNPFFQAPLFKDWPYPKVARIVSDHTVVEQNIVAQLKRYFPAGKYTADKAGRNFERLWKTDTGWRFDVMTTDQDPKEFEGATLGLVWFDEPPTKAIFSATIARMRKGGLIIITATLLKGSGWLYDELIADAAEELKSKGDSAYLEADLESACEDHGVRGFLKHADIERISNRYNKDEIEWWARVGGRPAHFLGRVFKNFHREIHIVKPFAITKRDFVVVEYLDPHPRTPDAVTWLAIDKNLTWFVVDELFTKSPTGELATDIRNKADLLRVIDRRIDPSAFIEDKHTNISLAAELNKLGLYYQQASKDRALADRRIMDYLDYTMQGGVMLRTPQLYIFENCRRTIWELEHYEWDDWTGKTADRKDLKQTPIDKDDHCLTADTLVDCADGQHPIEELVGKEGLVWSIDGLRRFSGVRKTRKGAKIYRLTLSDGRSIDATKDHLILSDIGWVGMQSLRKGNKIIDIGQWVRYNESYGSKSSIAHQTGFSRVELLSLRKVFPALISGKGGYAATPSGLGISQKENSEWPMYPPQGWQPIQQPNRELGIENSTLSSIGTYDKGAARVGATEYVEQCYPKGGRMAQISSIQVALRQIEEKTEGGQETTPLYESLRSLRRTLLFRKTKQNKILRQAVQMASLGAHAEVESIKFLGFQDVYNLEVETDHCFSVNGGLIVHNCIENIGRALAHGYSWTPYRPQEVTAVEENVDLNPFAE